MSKADLEAHFLAYLEWMQPEPRYVKLFNAIVLDVCREKQAQNLALSVSLRQRIEELQTRKDRLIDLRSDKEIGPEDFQRRLDKLNEEITLAEMQERDAKLEGYDMERVLAFAEHVVLNAGGFGRSFRATRKSVCRRCFSRKE